MTAAPAITSFRRAAWVLLALNILDIFLTVMALRAGAHEANPLSKFLIETRAIYPLKVIIPGFIVFGSYYSEDRIDELACRRIWCIIGIYLLVVVMNIFTWSKYLSG